MLALMNFIFHSMPQISLDLILALWKFSKSSSTLNSVRFGLNLMMCYEICHMKNNSQMRLERYENLQGFNIRYVPNIL